MRSFVAYSLLASATFASALERRWDYPTDVPALERRQEPGTPRYACHEDCGLLITLGREDGFCDNSEWNERYGRCMICANTFEIWIYYKNGVTSAAEQCGLSPTPSPSGFTASSTVAEVSTTAVVEVSTTAAPVTTEDEAEESTTAVADETTAPDAAATSTSAAGETDAGETDSAPTSDAAVETTGSSVPTTLSTAAVESKSSESAADATETDSAATHTTGGSIGTIGVTHTPASTPSTVIVSGAAKQLTFGAAFGVAAAAMLAVY